MTKRPLHLLLNLGPVTAARLRAVGIGDEATLRRLGATAAYRRVKHAYPRETSLVLLYALHGAIAGMPWMAVSPDVRAELRRKASDDG
jgi:hypothetical protein